MPEKSLGDSKSYRQGCSGVGTLGNGVPTPFCTSNVTWRCGIQTIIFKHGCVLTDVLATRSFVLLDKSKQLVKKSTNWRIQCGTSCRRVLTLFKLFVVVFIFGVGTPWRVARNFCTRGKQQPCLNIYIFNSSYFQSIIHETCIFLAFFSWTYEFRFQPANDKPVFVKLASLKSLYLVKFQVSTLDDIDSHHLLVKLSLQKRLWKSLWYKSTSSFVWASSFIHC